MFTFRLVFSWEKWRIILRFVRSSLFGVIEYVSDISKNVFGFVLRERKKIANLLEKRKESLF